MKRRKYEQVNDGDWVEPTLGSRIMARAEQRQSPDCLAEDGSVREKHNEAILDRIRGVSANSSPQGKFDAGNPNVPQANDNADATGLPLESTKPDRQAKLEASRAWLKDYFKRNPEQGT